MARARGERAGEIVNQPQRALPRRDPRGRALANCRRRSPASARRAASACCCRTAPAASIEYLDATLQKFLAAARKRPELGTVNSRSRRGAAAVRRRRRDKALKQGVALSEVYATLQTFLGGSTSTTSTASAASGACSCRPRAPERTSPETSAQFYVRNNDGQMVPLSSLVTTRPTTGPEYTMRFNLYRAAEITGTAAPGYSSGQALAALEEVARDDAAARHGLRLERPVVPGEARLGQRAAPVRAVAAVRVPDPGRALRELVAAVQRAARRRSRSSARSSACCCASSTTTSTRRSASSCWSA